MSKRNRGHFTMSGIDTFNEWVYVSVSLGLRAFYFSCSKVTDHFEIWANVFHADKCWRWHFTAVLSRGPRLERGDLFPCVKSLGLLPEILLFLTGTWSSYDSYVGEIMMKPHVPVGFISRIIQKSFQIPKRISYQAEYSAWVSQRGTAVKGRMVPVRKVGSNAAATFWEMDVYSMVILRE